MNAEQQPLKKSRMTKMKLSNAIFVASIVAWPLLLFVVFEIIGNIANITVAFQRYDIDASEFYFLKGKNTFDNFARFFRELGSADDMGPMFGRAAFLWVLGLAMTIPHILVSFCLHKKVPGSGLFIVILYLPGIISSVVWVLIYRNMVEYGMPALLKTLFDYKIKKSFFMDSSKVFGTLVFYGLWLGFASGMVLNLGTMNRIPPELVEAGKIDGMNTLQEFWYIAMPAIFPIMSIGLITCPIGIFTNSPSTFVFFGKEAPPEIYTIGYYFFNLVYGETEVNYPYSAAASITMTCIAAPVSMLIRYVCEHYGPNAEF